jgi:ribosomal protein L37AE/L43A
LPDQVRCPNCGGYRVSRTREYVISRGKKKTVSLSASDYLAGIITLGLMILLAVAANNAVKRAHPPVYGEYICDICGNKWASGDAQPRTVNPDLLNKLGAEQADLYARQCSWFDQQQRSADRNRDR